MAALVITTGCQSNPPPSVNRASLPCDRGAIEARALLVFSNAVLIKPWADAPATEPAFTFAPLLVQQVARAKEGSNKTPDTVYYQLGATEVAGRNRLQISYWWSCGEGQEGRRGVRLTLDAQGLPVIWEVLDDRPGPHVVFVSQSLEEKAKAAFGLPAAGRRFAIEQPFDNAPEVVVARVIDDGPVAMGPIVHLTSRPCAVSAVICRCMPTQAHKLVGTRYYELKPWSDARKKGFELREPSRELEKELRLPPAF